MTPTERVLSAIQNTPQGYLDELLKSRSAQCEENSGSVFHLPPDKLFAAITRCWYEEYPHPEIQEPAVGFKSKLSGELGLVELSRLNPQVKVILEDPNGTGFVSLVVEQVPRNLVQVEHFTMIVGPSQRGFGEQVWKFHPGDPVRPSYVKVVTAEVSDVRGAIDLGFEYAKVRRAA